MKGRVAGIILTLCLAGMVFSSQAVAQIEVPPEPAAIAEAQSGIDLAPNAVSAILMDVATGTVLYEKNGHQTLPPASITKIMTMLLVMEAITSGKTSLDEVVQVSQYAASMGGSQIFLEEGEKMTVRDLLKGVALASGNDASVALAEHLSGSEELFVQQMNQRAQELGMKNTHFVNSNGLPADEHYTTAYDVALMSRALMLHHEEITEYTGLYQDYLRQDSDNPFWLVNTNKLVRFYDGADGIKTGYTHDAGFCLSASAKRGDLRVIAVVMGEPNAKTRNQEITRMLDYAFSNYTLQPLYKKGDWIAQAKVDKGERNKLDLYAPQDMGILMKKGEDPESYQTEVVLVKPLKAPVQKGQVVGQVVVKQGEQTLYSFDLTAEQEVGKASMWNIMKRTFHNTLFPGQEPSPGKTPEQQTTPSS